jgi:hypothetical protein
MTPMTLGPQFDAVKSWEGDQSMEITAGATSLVKARGAWSPIGGSEHVDTARHLLDAVDKAPVTKSAVYSGHGGSHANFKVGDELDIPLMSTSSKPEVARGFAGDTNPTVYKFSSHRSVPVNSQEHLVSGKYQVTNLAVRQERAEGRSVGPQTGKVNLDYVAPLKRT